MKFNIKTPRVSGLMIYNVTRAAPNNNPNGTGPRILPDDFCLEVTGVAVRRKYRNILDDHNTPAFLHLEIKNPDAYHVFESRHRGLSTDALQSKEMALSLFAQKVDGDQYPGRKGFERFFDARMFGVGALDENSEMVEDEKGEKKKVKGKAGAKTRLMQTGPFSLDNGLSIGPATVLEYDITKFAPLRDELILSQSGDMANGAIKHVRHALMVHKFSFTPSIAGKSFCTDEDVEVMKKLLPMAWDFCPSLTRPADSIQMVHIWWAEHENMIGSFPPSTFHKAMTPTLKDGVINPTSLNDYNIPTEIPESIKRIKVVDLMKDHYNSK